jgi:hypothetical protein
MGPAGAAFGGIFCVCWPDAYPGLLNLAIFTQYQLFDTVSVNINNERRAALLRHTLTLASPASRGG